MPKKTITKISPKLAEGKSAAHGTDWEKLRSLSDDQIRARRADDPNFPKIDWKSVDVELIDPIAKTHVSIRLDSDIVEFFKSKGKGYQTRINQVLRSYVDHKENVG